MNKLKNMINKILFIDNKVYKCLYKHKDNLYINITACLGNIILILFIIFLVYFLPIKYGEKISIVSLISLFFNTLIIFIIKFTVRRKRLYGKNPLLVNIETYSFPSGHINRISALIIPFYYYPLISFFFIILSIAVGLARMIKGYHYLSDCIVGFLIGIIIGFFVNAFSYLYLENILQIINSLKNFL
jgi:undecaprenyl-diphosphatase